LPSHLRDCLAKPVQTQEDALRVEACLRELERLS
jgi:hypothetical protein